MSDPQAISQLQRLTEFMVWKNTAVHKSAAEYEELTNVWGYIPISKFNPIKRGENIIFPSEKADLFNKIVENDRAQEGAQAVLSLMEDGLSLKEIKELYPTGSNSKLDLVFEDPGVNARLKIETLAKNFRDPEESKTETIRILRETVDAYKKQNEPEQALIFLPELIKEKYGEEGKDILQKLVNKRGDICDTSTTCGGLFQSIEEKIDDPTKLFVLNGVRVSYPKEWSNELANDVKELYDENLKIQQDENRKKFRGFVEGFFDAEELTYGALLSIVSGGTGAIIGRTSQLAKSAASPLGKAYYTVRGAAALSEDVVIGTGFGYNLIETGAQRSLGTAVISPNDLNRFKDVKIRDTSEIWKPREPFTIELSDGRILEYQPVSLAEDMRMQVRSKQIGGEVRVDVPFRQEEIKDGFRLVEEGNNVPRRDEIISLKDNIFASDEYQVEDIRKNLRKFEEFIETIDLEKSFGIKEPFKSLSREEQLDVLTKGVLLNDNSRVIKLSNDHNLRIEKIIYPNGATYVIVEDGKNVVHIVSVQGGNVKTYKAPLDSFLEARTIIFKNQ